MRRIIILGIVLFCSGCVPKVDIQPVGQVRIQSNMSTGVVDTVANQKQLLSDLYTLLKTNEKTKVPICEASKEKKQCIRDGYSVFVWGGVIPGLGGRTYYFFSDISLNDDGIQFSKDNSKTTFIGTPMYTRENVGHIFIKDGGLQVEMANYYANWAGVGNMTMAEGWAIDYMDYDNGVVGLQLELNISGLFVLGGGSKYVLFTFPNRPDPSKPHSIYNFRN